MFFKRQALPSDSVPMYFQINVTIEIVIKFLESSAHTNVIKITIPKNGRHFERRAANWAEEYATSQYVAV